MVSGLATRVLNFSSWKTTLLAVILASATVASLNVIATPKVVAATGGFEPFDVVWPLGAPEILQGLDAYDADARRAYLLFAALDIPFPIFAGLFQMLLWGWLTKSSGFTTLITFAKRGGVLLAFIPSLFDLSENAGFVVLIMNPPDQMTFLIQATSFVHACKMHSIKITFAISGILVVIALAGWLSRRFRNTSS